MVLGVVMTLPGVAAAGTVMINTDSTLSGATTSAPPLPQVASSSAPSAPPPLPQAGQSQLSAASAAVNPAGSSAAPSRQNDLEWVRVGADGAVTREDAEVGRGSTASPAATAASADQPPSASEPSVRAPTPAPVPVSVTAATPQDRSSTSAATQQRWRLEPGLLKDQLISWGKRDPMWEVIWEGSRDVEIEVSHNFYGELDESVIAVVKALAQSGTPIRVMRARANHKLIVRSGK